MTRRDDEDSRPRAPLFKPGKARKALQRIESRAVAEYRPLYKDGRSRALDRAEELAKVRAEEAAAEPEEKVEADTEKVEREFWPKVQRVARKAPYLEDLIAAFYAMRDPKTPLRARAVLAFALLYFLWTFDIIPDFLGIVGFADDGTVLATVIAEVGGAITEDHRAKAREALGVVDEPRA